MDISSAVPVDATTSFAPSATASSDIPSSHVGAVIDQLVEAISRELKSRRSNLRATYRLQLHGKGFRFFDATSRIAYLAALGISHVYSSPVLKSQSGSNHGYDVVDPTELNDELGSQADFDRYVETLHHYQLGQILDIVPNHMSVAADENRWWMDVLKHGPASRYARYFDIDWEPVRANMAGRVLLPMLDASSGEVLEAGRFAVRFRSGGFYVEYEHGLLPLEPKTWIEVLLPGLEKAAPTGHRELLDSEWIELYSIIAALRNLPTCSDMSESSITERYRETLVIEQRLNALIQRSNTVAEHISRNLRDINGRVGDPRSFDRLERLLELQPYRMVHWKASSDEINYRRFFDVSTLAALSIENLTVFEDTHQLFFKLAATGQVDACRIDHVDGLFDPGQYLWRLQWGFLRELAKLQFGRLDEETAYGLKWDAIEEQLLARHQACLAGRTFAEFSKESDPREHIPAQSTTALVAETCGPNYAWPLTIYVEKILGSDEPLPSEWLVMGTTGYDFLNLLNGLFIDPVGYDQLKKDYGRFVGTVASFDDIVTECKRLILSGPMQSEVTLLASRLDRIAKSSRYSRDFTLNALEFAIQEIIACFSVYRTYIHHGRVSPRDEQIVQRAAAMAKRRNPAIETNTFDFVRDVLLLKEPYDLSKDLWSDRDFLVGRFQQVTSPVQAKGVEDTAFYRYIPLLSVDEVGGEPRHAVISKEHFHQQNSKRHTEWPASMLATTTHDTKRSEDVRARLNVLSELPGLWRKTFQRWHRLNRKHVRQVDGHDAPCRNDQWLFYQTLVGVWPVSPPFADERRSLIERLTQYMEKATHEAKQHTSWISPNPGYDAAVKQFVQSVLAESNSKFGLDLQSFVDSVLDFGLINAASQVLIKLMSPGVPDIYQGQELWDFSLVDPDNRRPVDYDLRHHLLNEVRQAMAQPDSRLAFVRYLRDHPRDNRFKLFVLLKSLELRELLNLPSQELHYQPLRASGRAAEHLVAFAWCRRAADSQRYLSITVAPRFLYKLSRTSGGSQESLSTELFKQIDWSGTRLELPHALPGQMHNLFTGYTYNVTSRAGNLHASESSASLDVAELLQDFPLALLSGLERPEQ